MRTLLICITSIFPLIGVCGEALLTGQGQVLSSPDYVELNIIVESKCFSTPQEARKANDEAASDIVKFLNTKVSAGGFYNKVITKGGYTHPYQTYYQNKVLCQGTFQKTNTITFRTTTVEKFEVLFDEIQKEVYKHFSSQPRSLIESSVSYVTMSNPQPQLSIEKRSELEQKALTMALNNAKAKLEALFNKNQIQNLKMIEVSELPPQEPQPRPVPMVRGAMAMGAEKISAAPVQFDDQWIYRTVYFRFSFDDVSI